MEIKNVVKNWVVVNMATRALVAVAAVCVLSFVSCSGGSVDVNVKWEVGSDGE